MSSRPCLRLAAWGLAAALAGCRGGAGAGAGAGDGPAGTRAEPDRVRLANQAAAIARLSEENDKLTREIEELRRDNRRLRAALQGKTSAPQNPGGERPEETPGK